MAYDLGKVKAWVAAAARDLGQRFGVKDIGGWRAQGSVPGSDHPRGLALDLMTASRGQGDAIAAYARANAARLGVTYVIWNRRIWNRGDDDWKPYSGPSPHTDHVHVSFQDSAPGAFVPAAIGLGGLDLGIGEAVGRAAGALRDMATPIVTVGQLADKAMWLALPTTMVRLVSGGIGLGLLVIGVWLIAREARHAR